MQDRFDSIDSLVAEIKGTTGFLEKFIFPIPSILFVVVVLGGILIAKMLFG
jgi:hypothetical protein